MTDWDPSIIEVEPSRGDAAFVWFFANLIWLVCWPLDLISRRKDAHQDDGEDLPDPCCAIDPITIHIGVK